MSNNELRHFGILGMKWGVRRSKRRNKNAADEKAKNNMKKAVKKRRTLSVNDLKDRIERIKMERELKTLTAEELSPGRRFTSEILISSGKKVATALLTGATLYGLKAALTGELDIKEAVAYMMPKPKK